MRARRAWVPLLILSSVWLGPSSAQALRRFMSQVPNGPRYGCVLCHTNTVTVAFNLFGDDVRARLLEDRPDWALLRGLDSDGDGQTNGEELGDPCGTWRPGEPAGRYTELSLPGDQNSWSATPRTPECEPAGGGPVIGPEVPPDEDVLEGGGCRCVAMATARSPSGGLALVAGLLSGLILRRGRRRGCA